MAFYRKKPVVIEAMELLHDTNSQKEIAMWCGGDLALDGGVAIKTLEGTMIANIGDFVIKGVNGEFYPCKPDIFEKTYEPA